MPLVLVIKNGRFLVVFHLGVLRAELKLIYVSKRVPKLLFIVTTVTFT